MPRFVIIVCAAIAIGCSEERPSAARTETERAPERAVAEPEPTPPPSDAPERAPAEVEPAPAPAPTPELASPTPSEHDAPETSPPPDVAPTPAEGEGDDEDEGEALVPLTARLAEGPLRESPEEAAMAGLVGGDEAIVDATVTHRRDTFLLVRVPEAAPQAHARRTTDPPPRWSIYLVRVRAVGEALRREAGILLYDFAVADYENDCDDAPIEMESELRARDLDGDGEVEVTVIAKAAAVPVARGSYNPLEECGLVAFLVGADDLEVQARFSRRHHLAQVDAGGELYSRLDTTWRLEDLNGDGHADLRVTESYRSSFDFMGDDIGNGEVAGPEHARGANRRSIDCLYDPGADRWACPTASPPLGQSLFRDREVLIAGTPTRPPEW